MFQILSWISTCRRASQTGYEREGQAIFQMIQRGDFIKPGWWHWRCRRESCSKEDVAYGYVQAGFAGPENCARNF